jgi:hypothetical protein
MFLIKLSPYAKSIITGIAALIAVIAKVTSDGSITADDIAAVIGGIAATYAVWRVPNAPLPSANDTKGEVN